MNSIIVFLPVANNDEDFFLPKIENASNALKYLKSLKEVIEGTDEEIAEWYFDEEVYKSLIKMIPGERGIHNQRLLFMSKYIQRLTDFRDRIHKDTIINICGSNITNKLVNIFLEIEKDKSAVLINQDSYKLEYELKSYVSDVVNLDYPELHRWFVEHRYPIRTYDYEYHKPGDKVVYRGGHLVSPKPPFPHDVLMEYLHNAVGKSGSDRIYYKVDTNTIIVFYNENLDTPTFHGHIIKTMDNKEMAKIDGCIIAKINKVHPI